MNTVSHLYLAFPAMLLATNYGCTLTASNLPVHFVSKSPMISQGIRVRSITLLAREEKSLPTGQPPTPNRDIGFASVFLRLENATAENAKLVIKSIQIVSNGDIQMARQSTQAISLKPLENSENAFHLTNKTGYSSQGRAKAVITYQIQDQVQVIESSPVEIDRL